MQMRYSKTATVETSIPAVIFIASLAHPRLTTAFSKTMWADPPRPTNIVLELRFTVPAETSPTAGFSIIRPKQMETWGIRCAQSLIPHRLARQPLRFQIAHSPTILHTRAEQS